MIVVEDNMGDLLVETKLVPKLHEKSKELEMRVFVDDERLVVEVEEVDVLKNTVDDVFDVDLELDVIVTVSITNTYNKMNNFIF